MEAKLRSASVPVRCSASPAQPPDYLGEMVRWFNQHLIPR